MSTMIRISETEPTALLRDFCEFISYLKTHRIVLTSTQEFIGGKELYALNQKMSEPVPDTTTRTRQTLYPQLLLFYHLALSGKLFRKVPGKGGRPILEATDRLAQYEELKPTERYFFLLETLWVDCDWKKLQSGHSFRFSPEYDVSPLMELLSGSAMGMIKKEWKSAFSYNLLRLEYLVLHLATFGFWRAVLDPEAKRWSKHHIKFKRIELTEFGAILALILSGERSFLHWNLPTRKQSFGEWKVEPGEPLDDDQLAMHRLVTDMETETGKEPPKEYKGKAGEPFYQPFASLVEAGELERSLPRKGIEFADGVYCFKAALRKTLWRRIEVAGRHTLDDLHYAIQEAYDFDDDHLYAFFMDGEAWSDDKFTSPNDEEGPYVDEVRIGELGLSEGQRILYLFDYGDEWRFQVTLEEIRKSGTKPRNPKIVEQKGKAPEQYGHY